MKKTKGLPLTLLRISKWILLSVALILTITIVFVIGAVGTSSGRQWSVTNSITWLNKSAMFENSGLKLELNGFKTSTISRYYIADLKLYKENTIWLHATEFSTTLSLSKLWQKQITIKALKADTIRYRHINRLGDDQATTPEPTPDPNSSKLKLPAIVLHDLQVNSLIIEGLIPEELIPPSSSVTDLRYSFTGNGEYSHYTGLNFNIEADSDSAEQPDLAVSVISNSSSSSNLEMRVKEPPNGWLGYWLRVPNEQPVNINVTADLISKNKSYELSLYEFSFPIADSKVKAKTLLSYQSNEPSNQVDTWRLIASEGLIEVANTKHSFAAKVSQSSLDANLLLDKLPLGLVKPWLQNLDDGTLSGAIALSNTVDDPNFTAEVESKVTYDNKSFTLNIAGSGDLDLITINTFNGRFGETRITANGLIDLVSNNNDIKFNVSNFSTSTLESFDISLPSDLEVNIASARGELKGAFQSPAANFIAQGNGRYKNESFNINSDIEVDGERIYVNDVSLELSEGLSRVHGDFNWKTYQSDFIANINNIPLKLVELVGVSLPDTLTAQASAVMTAQGPIDQLSIGANLSLDGILEETPFDVIANGELLGTNGQLTSLVVNSAEITLLTGQGQYKEGTYKADLVANKIPLDLLKAFNQNIPAGLLSTNIKLDGSAEDLSLNGDIRYSSEFYGFVDTGKKELIPFEVYNQLSTNNSVLHIDTKLKADSTTRGTIAAKIPINRYLEYFISSASTTSKELPIEVHADADIDLEAASVFLDQDINQLEGIIEAHLTVGGSVAKPRVDGKVVATDANYFNSLTGTRLSDLNCSLVANNQTFSIERCTATDGAKGSYSVLGDLTLPGEEPNGAINSSIVLKSVNILRRSDIESQATGDISITGDFDEILAQGDIEVAPFEAIIDMNVGSSAPELNVIEIYPAAEHSDSSAGPKSPTIHLDVSVTASQQAFLRGRGLEAELSGNIKLAGTAKNPEYNGEFNTIRGEFEVFGKEFNIEQGQVSFVNSAAAIAINGKYEEDDIEITAEINGQNDDYEISFTSVPSMPEDEILSYIIFGESVADIEPLKAIQLALAIQKLQGGGGSFDALGTARDLLDVDSISIESQSADDESEGGLNIGVGKYLNDKTYLELERTPDPAEPWKGNIEIELTPRIFLETTTGGTSGLDSAEIIWQKDY